MKIIDFNDKTSFLFKICINSMQKINYHLNKCVNNILETLKKVTKINMQP